MQKDVGARILDATLEVVAREKISGTRMHLIAKEARMTQSNLHYYFPTKNDLLIALLNRLQDDFSENRKKVVDLDEKSVAQNIRAIFAEKKEMTLHNRKLDYLQFDYWVQGTVDLKVRDTFQRTFEVWRRDIQTVLVHGKTDAASDSIARMTPYLMVSLMMGASMQYLMDEGSFDLDEYFTMAEQMVVGLLEVEEKREV
ncbi:MAG TPA: TetR/AcrR family transcriptional regulator [Bacillota bacterium]|nr:TetR/AcrR family transcriptional regulator [Bacillota bacterium]